MPLEHLITAACLNDRSKPRYLAIADELALFIENGQLPTGERLPPQRKLAQSLGVTTSTVSHAYEVLEQRGMATARVGDGTYVRTPEPTVSGPGTTAPAAIDLAHNVAIATHDARALAETLQQIAQDAATLRQTLSYQPEAGHLQHRRAGARWMQRFGLSADPSRIMVTQGAQHGLSLILRSLAHPGDVVFTESLSYPGLQALARLMRLQLVGIEMDREGMLPAALEHAVKHISGKLVYCSPSLHNPTNATMSTQRRRELAQLVQKHNLLWVEDCVHAAAQANPLPAVAALLPEHSFVLSSFSKVMGPGLRVGYIEAASTWLSKLAASMRADCWMVAPLMPEIASRWIESNQMEQLIAAQRSCFAERLALARPLLQGMDYQADPESPLIWLSLPEQWRAGQFASALRQAGVLIRTADHFAVGRSTAPHAIRISLNAAPTAAQVEDGVRTLLSVMHGSPTGPMDP